MILDYSNTSLYDGFHVYVGIGFAWTETHNQAGAPTVAASNGLLTLLGVGN